MLLPQEIGRWGDLAEGEETKWREERMGATSHQALQQLLWRRPFTAAACATLLRLSAGVRLRSSSAASFPLSPCASLPPPPAGRRVLRPAICTGGYPRGRRQFSDGVGVRAAAQVNDPGAIDSPLMQSMEKKVNAALLPPFRQITRNLSSMFLRRLFMGEQSEGGGGWAVILLAKSGEEGNGGVLKISNMSVKSAILPARRSLDGRVIAEETLISHYQLPRIVQEKTSDAHEIPTHGHPRGLSERGSVEQSSRGCLEGWVVPTAELDRHGCSVNASCI